MDKKLNTGRVDTESTILLGRPPHFKETEMTLNEALDIMKQVFALHISSLNSPKLQEVFNSAGQLQEVTKVIEEECSRIDPPDPTEPEPELDKKESDGNKK
jgi:hypothetical protein